MKYLILIFLSVPFFLFGQEATKDSLVIVSTGGGNFEEAQFVEYSNGAKHETHTPIGTAIDVANKKQAEWTRKTLTMASDARFILTFQKRITEIKRENNTIKALTGISPLDTIQALLVSPFLEAGWTLKADTVTRPMVFSVNGSGAFRHKVGTDAAKGADLFYDIIRLNNYPTTGVNTDLYKKNNGNYADLSGRYLLRRPGGPANSPQPVLQPAEQPAQNVDKNGKIIKSKTKKQ